MFRKILPGLCATILSGCRCGGSSLDQLCEGAQHARRYPDRPGTGSSLRPRGRHTVLAARKPRAPREREALLRNVARTALEILGLAVFDARGKPIAVGGRIPRRAKAPRSKSCTSSRFETSLRIGRRTAIPPGFTRRRGRMIPCASLRTQAGTNDSRILLTWEDQDL